MNVEKGATSQGMQVPLEAGKGQGMDIPLEPPEGTPCPRLDFSQFPTSGFQHWKTVNVCYFKRHHQLRGEELPGSVILPFRGPGLWPTYPCPQEQTSLGEPRSNHVQSKSPLCVFSLLTSARKAHEEEAECSLSQMQMTQPPWGGGRAHLVFLQG